jgi:hypothetical protein
MKPDKPLELIPNYVDETIEIRKSTQVGPIIDANREEAIQGASSKTGVMGRKFASVPLDVLQHWKNKYGVDYTKIQRDPETRVRFYKLLHEYKAWKTYHGGLRH